VCFVKQISFLYEQFNQMKYLPLFAIFILLSCHRNMDSQDDHNTSVPHLVKIWETDTLFKANESAAYHAGTNAIYISCMGNYSDVKDGDGYIAKLGLDGSILKLHWITGLNCPKGLSVHKDKLYVTDIDEMVIMDIKSAKIFDKISVPLGKFYNDIDVAPNGDVYLSEGVSQEIIKYSDGKSSMYYSNKNIGGLNGVHVSGDQLLFTGSKGLIHTINNSGKLTMIADSVYNGDGIESYRKGYFCSSWKGVIYYFTAGGNTAKLIDTSSDKVQSGDLEIIENKKLLISPTLFNNKVIGYRIVN
jgi:hypothetical protein